MIARAVKGCEMLRKEVGHDLSLLLQTRKQLAHMHVKACKEAKTYNNNNNLMKTFSCL